MRWKLWITASLCVAGGVWYTSGGGLVDDPPAVESEETDALLPERVDSVSQADLRASLSHELDGIELGETNVVLAIICTMRKDRLEPYGHRKPTSPFLDELAKRSVVLERHFTQAPWTRPSMGALFTGVWPRVLQLDNPGTKGSLTMVLRDEHETIAEALAANAYETIGSTGNPNIKKKFGLAQGLERSWEPKNTYKQGHLIIDGFKQVDYLLEQLEEVPKEKPVYMQLVLTDTHQPRKPKKKYLDLFKTKKKKKGARLKSYDASVRKADAILAELFVEVAKQRPNTLFIIASDHGEGLRYPKHHGVGHGNYLYESHIASPSIWHHPSLAPKRFPGLTMNIDVKPTILGLLGVKGAQPSDGHDMSGALRGTDEWAGHPYVFSETFYGKSKKATVISPTHQYIVSNRKKDEHTILPKLFAASDPLAQDDLFEFEPEISEKLDTVLTSWLNDMDSRWDQAGAPLQTDIEPELEAQLQALGYME